VPEITLYSICFILSYEMSSRQLKNSPFVTQASKAHVSPHLVAATSVGSASLSIPLVQAVPNCEGSNGDAKNKDDAEVTGRIGVTPIHRCFEDVSFSPNLSECWHDVYSAGRGKCRHLFKNES